MMDERMWVVLLAGLMVVAIPFAPHMVRLRIRALNRLGFNRFAAFHERAFLQLVWLVRVIFALIAMILAIWVV